MIEKIFPAKDEALEEVTNFVVDQMEAMGSSPKAVMQVTISLEEMFVNVAHYAYGDGEGTVKVILNPEDDQISIQLVDEGTPFDPLAKDDPDITLKADQRKIGGLGIFMTKQMMDEVRYSNTDGKNILTMIKKIK